MFDKELYNEYILYSYLGKLLPADPAPEFDLDNRVKLEYYCLEKTYEGAIELEEKTGEWKPTTPKRAAKSNDQQVYERSIFPTIFEDTAQSAYIENMATYEQLFIDADKYHIIQKVLAKRLYQELHNHSK